MVACLICLKDRSRQNMKFSTSRMKICRWCVRTLNRETWTVTEAEERRAADLHTLLFHRNMALISSGDPARVAEGERKLRGLDDFVEGVRLGGFSYQCSDPNDGSVEIKIIRAFKKGLLLHGRQYTARPKNWAFTAAQLKHRDQEKCNLCDDSRMDKPDLVLHAHHIVHRSYGGSNNRKNLVVLCYSCHQKQHPDIVISMTGGEPDGVYCAPEEAELPSSNAEHSSALTTTPAGSFDRAHALQAADRHEDADQPSPHSAQAPKPVQYMVPDGATCSQAPATKGATQVQNSIEVEKSRSGCAILAAGVILVALMALGSLMEPNTDPDEHMVPAQLAPTMPVAPIESAPPATSATQVIPPISQPEIDQSAPQLRTLMPKGYMSSRRDKAEGISQLSAEALPEADAQPFLATAPGICPPHTTQVDGKCCVGSVRNTRGEFKAIDPSHCYLADRKSVV